MDPETFPDIATHFGPYSENKQTRSKPGNILVDDRPDNCTQWTEKGGTAINVPVGDEQQGLINLQKLFNTKSSLHNLSQMTRAVDR